MSRKLSNIIDELSKRNGSLLPTRNIFTSEFIEQWSTKSHELCSQFQELESNEEREKWLKRVLNEILDVISEPQLPGTLSLPQISKLIDDMIFSGSKDATNQELTSMVGKMFVSVSHQLPHIDDNRLVALARNTNSLQKELLKYSRISTKLLNHEQTVLLRHLLKKSKYELRKFNLLAECPTGYSQVIMVLITAYNDPDKMLKIPYYLKQLSHIIGKYSLDSMRCLDIILQVSLNFITEHYKFLLELLKSSDYWPYSHPANNGSYETLNCGGNMTASDVIAFNLSQGAAYKDVRYIDMVCILIKHDFVNFMSIWENIGPDEKKLKNFFAQFEEDMETESMKGALNPLAMAAALTSEEDERDTINADEMGKDSELKIHSEDLQTEEEGNIREDESSKEYILNKGKIKLLEGLLSHGCLFPAFYVLKTFPKFIELDERIPLLISRVFTFMIEPLYQSTVFSPPHRFCSALLNTRLENGLISHKVRLVEEKCTHDPFATFELRSRSVFYFSEWSEDLEKIQSIEELFQKSHEYLSIMGTYLAKSSKLITEICRIGVADIRANPDTVDKWVDYTRKFIFPAVSLLETNPIIASDIYSLMNCLPFERRYFMYNEMLTKLSQDVLSIKVGFNKTEREARSILKALSVDNIEEESRKLAKLASTNPLAVLVPAVKQIENYDKVSELVVFAAKYFNDFAYDVLQYVLLLRLTNGKDAVQPDGVNQAMWVQRLSIFIADLARNCAKMDINNIITYILKTLHTGNIIAVSIMRELITKVGGIGDLNEVNLKQLRMLNSGDPLKKLARRLIFDFRDNNSELATGLLNLFAKQNGVSEVILLLYRLNVKANSQDAHYKILSSRCDEMNTLLWSFIELVKHCFKGKDFSDNVLPFDTLINEYHVSTPWAFHIWRDFMEEFGSKDGISGSNMLQRVPFEEVDFNKISRELFITFWRLSLYDIQFDKILYEERKACLEEERTATSSTRKKNELANKLKDLLASCLSHQKVFNQNSNMLSQHADLWNDSLSKNGSLPFFQHCIIPRVIFSPSDSIYASSFLRTFDISSLLSIFGEFVRSDVLCTLLFCCTRLEAGNIGIFYRELLGNMEEARDGNQLDDLQCRELYEWHSIITENVVETLCNKNYMSIRNGIEFMKHLSYVFPVVDTQIELVCLTLEQNLEGEQREDIKLPSNALLGHLKARLKKSFKLSDFCNLTVAEMEDQTKFQSELDEIKQYEVLLANEKKQAELRKKFEQNKIQREEAEKARLESQRESDANDTLRNALPTGPSADKLITRLNDVPRRFESLTEAIDEVCLHLKNGDINKVLSLVHDESEKRKIMRLTKVHMPIHDLHTSLYEILERDIRSLKLHSSDLEFAKKADALKEAVEGLNHDAFKSVDDATQSDSTAASDSTTKVSRYNASLSERPSSSAGRAKKNASNSKGEETRNFPREPIKKSSSSRFSSSSKMNSEKGDTKIEDQSGKPYYTSRQHRGSYQDKKIDYEEKTRASRGPDNSKRPVSTPSAPRALVFPERPSQSRLDSRTSRNSSSLAPYSSATQQTTSNRRAHDASQSIEERPLKRFRPDEKRYDFARQDSGRARDTQKENSDRSRYNKDAKTQSLPQGPKGSSENSSRYQG